MTPTQNSTPPAELGQLGHDLHRLARQVAATVAAGAGDADPDAARLAYKDALRMIARHATRVALQAYDFDLMVARCKELSAKRSAEARRPHE